jgi:hypothetical protein
MKLNHPAQIRLDTVLENCIFYNSPMYEFSHSLDPERTKPVALTKSPLQTRGVVALRTHYFHRDLQVTTVYRAS